MKRLALCCVLAFAFGCSSSGRTGSADLAGMGARVGSGGVSLSQLPKMPTGLSASANASFRRESGPIPMIPCTTETVAGCAARTCTFIQDLGVTPMFDPVTAGVVSISGGATPIAIMPAGDNTYPAATAADLWHGGEALTASAPGGVVPGFTLMVTAPAAVSFSAPASPVMLTSGQDLALPTAATSEVDVGFDVIADQQMPVTTLHVSCPLTPSGGTVTLPGAALALAPKGKPLNVGASTSATAAIELAGWPISFTATSAATFPGQRSSLQVTLQ
jgi:hypothetical protein